VEELDDSEIKRNAKRDYVRDHHHERSEKYIRDNREALGLTASQTSHEANIVGRIALGHRKVDLGEKTQFGEVAFRIGQTIRRDLLAAYLRLADELDTTAFRTPWAEYQVLDIYDETSHQEWQKHLSVSGFDISQGVIKIAGSCYDHGIFLRLQRLQQEIDSKLVEMRAQLPRPYASGDGFFVADPLPFHTVELNIEHEGYLPIDVKFELEHEQIVNLIMGERLYGDTTACIRELLQNAVDTCHEAREHRPATWKPEILVTLEEDGRVLSVADNGMGMDVDIVRRYFSRVGVSYYRSDDFTGTFTPISEFGIGVLSCFMIAEQIEVDSLRSERDPIHLTIESLTKSFVPRTGSRDTVGTKVALRLKPDIEFDLDKIHEIVRHYARHLDIPITITDGESDVTVVDRGMSSSQDEIERMYSSRSHTGRIIADQHGNPLFEELTGDGIRLGVTLTSDRDGLPSPANGASPTRGTISRNGFFVKSFGLELNWAVNAACELEIMDSGHIDLTADRTRISGDPTKLWEAASDMYCSAIDRLYERWRRQPSTPTDWLRFHSAFYRNGVSGSDDAYVPKKAVTGWRANAAYCTFSAQHGYETMSPDQIRDWQGRVFWGPASGHHQLALLSSKLSDENLVVVPPESVATLNEYEYELEWRTESDIYFHYGLACQSIMRQYLEIVPYSRLVEELGIEVRLETVGGRSMSFVDTAVYLGDLSLRIDLSRHRGLAVFVPVLSVDAQHPLSGVLARYCLDRELPRASKLEVQSLFSYLESGTAFTETDQGHLVETLKSDGVVPDDVEYEPIVGPEIPAHDCPYDEPTSATTVLGAGLDPVEAVLG